MSFNYRQFFKNFSYAVSSNLISLLITTLVVLIVPKLIGVNEYGYWQLYIFYASYVGFLHFGWSDGIYLREGGKTYQELDKTKIFSQFYMLILTQLLLAILVIILAKEFIHDENKITIFNLIAITMVIMNVRSLPLFVLQATNRIKEYAHITITDRIIYLILIIIALLFGVTNFEILIIADIFGRTISLWLTIFYCRDMIIRPISEFKPSFIEVFNNINVGIKLMLAFISSLLIIGVVRFGIERVWDVETFGKVSLTLSISNLMMLLINAIGLILFPVLRRTATENLSKIYLNIRDSIMVILLGLLILYYPLKEVMVLWLPGYKDSLMYMTLVFPMFLFEGRMALLINTYLKTMRQEKLMLKVNMITLLLSVCVTFLSAVVFRNLELTVLAIVILLAFKSIFAELVLSKILKINLVKDITGEIILTLLFIISGWFIDSWQTPIIYGLGYIVYLVIKRKNINKTISIFKNILISDK
ncbi:lipopolysaccharide biosynthesis protein [Paraliobacillus sp. JSM ZJ581]|uniref:lipopolysaccharide biosynthesis protein n=1 Tax=Paraliobacillus sp. JSM ZJ581 TaxID=3342118 RepID=UPI0035A83942